MIVCHCRAVSDRAIRAAISRGATTVASVMAETAASTCCGGCAPTVARIVDEELGASTESAPRSTRPLRVLQRSDSEAA